MNLTKALNSNYAHLRIYLGKSQTHINIQILKSTLFEHFIIAILIIFIMLSITKIIDFLQKNKLVSAKIWLSCYYASKISIVFDNKTYFSIIIDNKKYRLVLQKFLRNDRI